MTRGRNALAEIIKKLTTDLVETSVRALGQWGETHPGRTETVLLRHIHDEAIMRMRSFLMDADSALSPSELLKMNKSRTSKVQNQCLDICLPHTTVRCPTELQALMQKNAGSIAFTLIAVLRGVLETCVKGVAANPSCNAVRVVHMMFHDGVYSNSLAARMVLYFGRHFQTNLVSYRLLVWVCASHMGNLVAMIAVCGEALANPIDSHQLCGTCHRMYKHLLNDYFEEFSKSLLLFVTHNFGLIPGDPESQEIRDARKTESLQSLYGQAVLPDALLPCFNICLTRFAHMALEPDASIRTRTFEVLRKLVLFVEEHPVVTRFFLFGPCVNGLLRMEILGLKPAQCMYFTGIKARQENVKRLASVSKYFERPETAADLRQGALSLQLSSIATSISSQGNNNPDKEPLLVRLGKGEVQSKVSARLKIILSLLLTDEKIDAARCLIGLLTTFAHVVIRYEVFKLFPTALWTLTEKWNPNGWEDAILSLLQMGYSKVDTGYTGPLLMEARRRGNEADAVTYLMSSEVQAELKRIIVEASMNSMAAERKHWQDRRSEKTKVVSLTTASRNSQLSQYKRVREARTKQLAEARRRYESERHVNTWSLAVEKNKQWLPRPRGKLHWEHEVSDASARATVHAGDLESLRNFHDSNLESLKAERDARQEAAKLGLEVVLSDLPQTNSEWVGWIKRNESLFHDMLRNASGDRAKFSTRVFAENAQLPQDPRILPRRQAPVPAQSWMQKLLTSKPGFFCIQISGAKLWVFACHLLREVWALSLMKVGQGLLSLDNSVLLCDSFRPLPDVVAAAGLAVSVDAKDVIVHKVDVEVREASEDELILYVAYADLVEKPGRQQNVTEEDDEDDGELSFGETGSDISEFASDAESGGDPECSDSSASDAGGENVRGKAGSFVVCRNPYFTISNYKLSHSRLSVAQGMQIRVLDRWAKDELLGTENLSKAISGLDASATMMQLKAWMLWRCKQNAFLEGAVCRKRWWQEELEHLREEAGATTGCVVADGNIRSWVPEVFNE